MKTDDQGRLIVPMTLVLCGESLATSTSQCDTCGEELEDGRDLRTLVMLHPADYPAKFHRWDDLYLCEGCRKELLEVAQAAERRQEEGRTP